jgi:hypothetical protein
MAVQASNSDANRASRIEYFICFLPKPVSGATLRMARRDDLLEACIS